MWIFPLLFLESGVPGQLCFSRFFSSEGCKLNEGRDSPKTKTKNEGRSIMLKPGRIFGFLGQWPYGSRPAGGLVQQVFFVFFFQAVCSATSPEFRNPPSKH